MQESEFLVMGATVADGTGRPPEPRDILVRGEHIAAVEPSGRIPPDGHPVVDATNLVVAPGFIDTHSHADNAPLLAEDDTSKILQGVTTEVVGNCGFSLAPCSPPHEQTLAHLLRRIFPPLRMDWQTWQELDAVLRDRGFVTNYAPLLGHGTLRIAAFGTADRPPDDTEMKAMRRGLHDALDAGVFGMSTGLIYPPGVYSTTDELASVSEVLGSERVYATHMRGEADGLLPSIREALSIGRQAGCPVHLSHLKWFGRHNWRRMPEALDLIGTAAEDGLAVTNDVYPYTAGSTFLASCLPPPLLVDDDAAVLEKLRDPCTRDYLASTLEDGLAGWDNLVASSGWDGVLISTTRSHAYEGRTMAQIAEDQCVEPVDALIQVLVEEELQVSMVQFGLCEEDVTEVLGSPRTMIGSDSLPPGRGGRPHPRMFGAFPRFLGPYVRDRGLLPLGEAVQRVTGMPAETFRIPDRGYVRPGYVADLLAFDPEQVTDHCDYLDPAQTPTGIAWVMMAGRQVTDGQTYLGPRHGRRLQPS